MDHYMKIIALAIGYWYARKYGREAIVKINEFNAEKENKNQTNDQ